MLLAATAAVEDGLVAFEAAGTVPWLNAAACELTGWTAAEATGSAVADLLPIRQPDGTVLGWSPALSGSREAPLRLEIRRRDGTFKTVSLHTANSRSPRAPATVGMLVLRGGQGERAAFDEAQRNTRLLATAQRLAHLATWEWDVRTDEVVLSDEISGLFGDTRAVRKSSAFYERIHPDDHSRVREAVERAISGIQAYDVVFRLITAQRGIRVVRAMADAHWGDGKVVRLAGAIQDITEQRALESRLAIADRMVSVGTLAAGVAHEINNPLAYVVANTSFAMEAVRKQSSVRDSPALDEALEALTAVREGAERIRVIVRDLKTFSRPTAGKGGPLDVRRAIESALTMAGNEIRHRARLVRDFEEVPLVDADEARLGQLLLNLVVNAAQSIPEGALDRNEIHVRTRVKAGLVAIEIRDTGCGIAPEVLPRIFDPFFTTRPVGVGTGLGLAVCHGIASSFGGDIEVESILGQGSTFRLLLPAAIERAAPKPEPVVPAPTAVAPSRVYVIDDEPALTSAVRRALATHQDVVTFNYAGDALARLGGGDTCDVILCDLMMPRMSGMDFHDELRKLRPDLLDKVVFLTGGAFTTRAREFLDSVPNARLEKPFDLSSLAAVVSSTLKRRTAASS